MIAAITWDINPEITRIFGVFPLRYYSLLFVGGLFLGYLIVKRIMLKEGKTINEIDKLAFYIFIATILGARLGHCLFYEPAYYLKHPLEMILPFSFAGGEFEYTGFQGLASHGGILGVFLAIWYYSWKAKDPFMGLLDKVAIGGAIAAVFIRCANFMNSEIIGKPTGSEFGVIFKKVDDIARHPAQLYEAGAYLIIFFILYFLYKKYGKQIPAGFLFGLFFTLLFLSRFLIEFYKENQVAFEEGMNFNMGQLLSIPFMIGGLAVMIWKRPKKEKNKS